MREEASKQTIGAGAADAFAGDHHLRVRVYYEDTDFSGFVYHASYLRFFERGRTELLRDLGFSQSVLHDAGGGKPVAFVVRKAAIEFHAPARMDDLLTIATKPIAIGGASILIQQAALRDGAILASAQITIVSVSGGKACRMPAALHAAFVHAVRARTGAGS